MAKDIEAMTRQDMHAVLPTLATDLPMADDDLPEPIEPDFAAHLHRSSLTALMAESEALTIQGHGAVVTYSPKVFIPLTHLCRDVCHYCTFAKLPREVDQPYLSRQAVLAIARQGEAMGCREALFTLGDRPEARYASARQGLSRLGHATTLSYLAEMASAVLDQTGLLPHLNPGLLTIADYAALRPHAASMGIMLESMSERLCAPGGPHHGSPDKHPARRIASVHAAGQMKVPLTTGLLIGIGETRAERIEALVVIRDVQRRYGHIQEVIIQNFRAKASTRMAGHPDTPLDEHLWTIAVARLILGSEMSIQAPPNLHGPETLGLLLRAGVNDWGGVSPVTPDHVNPEAPWPHRDALDQATRAAGRHLLERLAIGPRLALDAGTWVDPALAPRILRAIDGRGLPRRETWVAGQGDAVPTIRRESCLPSALDGVLEKAASGARPDEDDIVAMFRAEGDDAAAIADIADRLRRTMVGEPVSYVINRNINYTNICLYHCGFCAFSKGSTKAARGAAYHLDLDTIGSRAAQAAARGATEVCLQGGIHPSFDGNFYLDVLRTVREAAPGIHIHAFSPLEIMQGARTLGLPLPRYLDMLATAGLDTLPGTAAEILDPEIRRILCPDKVSADEWIDVMRTAHGMGLRSTATIMFGHVDSYAHWARHLLRIRDLQEETGGFTEFVPLPFVHMEAPIWQKGRARSGPSFREAMLMHAISRIALHPLIPNIQVSWVKMGRDGAAAMLRAGANDIGGTLMDESITRAAGGLNGQMFGPVEIGALARSIGRPHRQRSTLYAALS